jgi:hypothetical protein
VDKVDRRIGDHELNKKRLQQLRVIIDKYRPDYDSALYSEKSKLPGGGEGKKTGYSSELAKMLQQKFGLQIFFHAKDGKTPYGYTVIDHTQKAVYKGGDLMPMAEFIEPAKGVIPQSKMDPAPDWSVLDFENKEDQLQITMDEPDSYLPIERKGDYNSAIIEYSSPGLYVPLLRIDISDDIDDEQINGRNRRRKRKARTNTR